VLENKSGDISETSKDKGNVTMVGLGTHERSFQRYHPRSLIVNITDNRGTSVDLNETVHATPMSTINHENNVLASQKCSNSR